MYNLTKSEHKTLIKPVANRVGPNTYDIDQIPDKKENVHPFLSSNPRFKSPKPSCGTFYVLKNTEKIKGGVFAIAPRFNYSFDEIPGPCDFELAPPKNADSVFSLNGSEQSEKQGKQNGKLFLCHVPLTSGPSPPSIPTKIDQYGYDFDKYGNLIKNIPRLADICECGDPDPPKYQPCTEWKKSNKERIQYQMSDAPLPGTYDPIDPSKLCRGKVCDYATQQENMKCSPVLRYPNDLYRVAYRNNYPAPGDYERIKVKRKYQTLVPFGVNQTKRSLPFGTSMDSPSPNLYTIPENIDHKKLKSNLTFGRSERFKYKLTDHTPPPGRYQPKDTIQDDLQAEMKRTRYLKGGFSVSSPLRPCTHPDDLPAPNQYCTQESKDTCKFHKKIPTSKFISKTKRFDLKVCMGEPNPFTYNSQQSYYLAHDKKSHLTRHWRRKRGFLVGLPERFYPFYGLASPFIDFNERLGPGCYDPYEYEEENKGFKFPQADRFSAQAAMRDCMPPPGIYEFKEGNTYTDSLSRAKHSFNIELEKSIAKRLNTNKLSKRDEFIKRVQGKKHLHCFLRPHLTVSEIKCHVKR